MDDLGLDLDHRPVRTGLSSASSALGWTSQGTSAVPHMSCLLNPSTSLNALYLFPVLIYLFIYLLASKNCTQYLKWSTGIFSPVEDEQKYCLLCEVETIKLLIFQVLGDTVQWYNWSSLPNDTKLGIPIWRELCSGHLMVGSLTYLIQKEYSLPYVYMNVYNTWCTNNCSPLPDWCPARPPKQQKRERRPPISLETPSTWYHILWNIP